MNRTQFRELRLIAVLVAATLLGLGILVWEAVKVWLK